MDEKHIIAAFLLVGAVGFIFAVTFGFILGKLF